MKKILFLLTLLLAPALAQAQQQVVITSQSSTGAAVPISTTNQLPIAVYDSGNHSGYCYTSNGSASAATFQSCGGGGGGSPGGSSGQVQYNNSSSFGGTALITIGTTGVTIGTSTFSTAPTVTPFSTAGLVTNTSGGLLGSTATIGTSYLSATGTANSTTFLRGDNTWATPAGGSGISIGTTTITGGTNAYFLYDNSGVVGNLAGVTASGDVSISTTGVATVTQIQGVATGTPTGTGNAVYNTSPTITTATLTDPIESGNMTSSATLTATSNTTLAAITGLTYNATSGAVYNFHIHLTGVANASGGLKVAFGGTASATSFTSTCWNWNGTTINAVTTQTTYSSSLTAQTAAYTDLVCDGTVTVNAAGTFILEAAQNASFGTSTTVLSGSSMTFQRSF